MIKKNHNSYSDDFQERLDDVRKEMDEEDELCGAEEEYYWQADYHSLEVDETHSVIYDFIWLSDEEKQYFKIENEKEWVMIWKDKNDNFYYKYLTVNEKKQTIRDLRHRG